MSGHSKWSTIKRKKAATDAKRGKLFTQLGRELTIAAKEGGGDPDVNVRLRLAIDRARASNMPKDNIERAIARGTGEAKDGIIIEEVYYEGYAPHGIALITFCVTDNRNRAVADIRHTLSKSGGSLGEAGSVSWQFNRVAYFAFSAEGQDEDEIFELAVEAGADDVIYGDKVIEIIGPVDSYKEISDRLAAAKIESDEAGLRMVPSNEITLSLEDTLQVLRVIDTLEELDDVQDVYSNLHVAEEMLEQLEVA
jgi:YebC/PmpR family DNA-binding regulatory protein